MRARGTSAVPRLHTPENSGVALVPQSPAMLTTTCLFYLSLLFDLAIAACLALALIATFLRNDWPIEWRRGRAVTGSSAGVTDGIVDRDERPPVLSFVEGQSEHAVNGVEDQLTVRLQH